jgi:hypothetical protein
VSLEAPWVTVTFERRELDAGAAGARKRQRAVRADRKVSEIFPDGDTLETPRGIGMPRASDSSWFVRATRVAEAGVWIWEILDDVTQQVIESSWASSGTGYDTADAAERAGRARLGKLRKRGAAKTGRRSTIEDIRRVAAAGGAPRLIIVPRSRGELYRDLKRIYANDANAEVVLDRRLEERRAAAHPTGVDRRRGDRRSRADVDAQLSAGRAVVVPVPVRQTDIFDADGRAVLFLCCAEHVVECGNCHTSYRLRWLMRSVSGFSCPKCRLAMTTTVKQHTETCPYWVSLRRVLQPLVGKVATG